MSANQGRSVIRDIQLAVPCPVCGGESFESFGSLYRCVNCLALVARQDVTLSGICSRCEKTNPVGAVYCGHCGHPLRDALVALRHCPQCGHPQMPGFGYCMSCGFAIAAALASEDQTICRVCARSVPAGGGFCANCGADWQEMRQPTTADNPYRYCPSCGHELSRVSDLCASCGTDASDYIAMIRTVTRDRVEQIVAEEEARLHNDPPAKAKRKPKNDYQNPAWADRQRRAHLMLIIGLIAVAGLLAGFIFLMAAQPLR